MGPAFPRETLAWLCPYSQHALRQYIAIYSKCSVNAELLWEPRTHQWVSFGVAGGHLLARRPFPRHGVAVEADILRPELQQGRPLVLLWAGCPGVGVHHPLGGILPGSPPSIELKTGKEGIVLGVARDLFCSPACAAFGNLLKPRITPSQME